MFNKIFYSFSAFVLLAASVFASDDTSFDSYLRQLIQSPVENRDIIASLSEELQVRFAILQSMDNSETDYSELLRRSQLEEQSAQDSNLAQQMQETLDKDYVLSQQLEEQSAQDAKLAQQLYESEITQSGYSSPTLALFNQCAKGLTDGQKLNIVKMKDCLVQISKQSTSAGIDVHKFNAMVRPYSVFVMELNKLMGLSSQYDYQSSITKLRMLNTSNHCKAEIDKLFNHLKNNSFEKETNLNSHHILSCMVDYLERLGNEDDKLEFFRRMRENTETNGGCYPGYIGRLLAFNMQIILHKFTNVRLSSQ